MALVKQLAYPNGELCGYHRVDHFNIDVSSGVTEITMGAYVSKEEARSGIRPRWTSKLTATGGSADGDVRGAIYAYLKTLPAYADAVDDHEPPPYEHVPTDEEIEEIAKLMAERPLVRAAQAAGDGSQPTPPV